MFLELTPKLLLPRVGKQSQLMLLYFQIIVSKAILFFMTKAFLGILEPNFNDFITITPIKRTVCLHLSFVIQNPQNDMINDYRYFANTVTLLTIVAFHPKTVLASKPRF